MNSVQEETKQKETKRLNSLVVVYELITEGGIGMVEATAG